MPEPLPESPSPDSRVPSAVRTRARSRLVTPALGLGCWAIGGPWSDALGNPLGWGATDDEQSLAAIRRGLELGVRLFDTADAYGTGHSERLLGQALRGHREDVVIATKWGNLFDEDSRTLTGIDASPEYARRALLSSLTRLQVDHVDLFQLHLSGASLAEGRALRDACEDLVGEGLIRGYGWSTDDPARAAIFAEGEHCVAVQYECSVLHDAPALITLAESEGLAGINRSPLAMGLVSGKYTGTGRLAGDDIRAVPPAWLRFFTAQGASDHWLAKLEAITDVLRSSGRTAVQGALAWLWARSTAHVPIPGFRTVEQVTDTVTALDHGPLTPGQFTQLEELIGDRDGGP